MTTVALGVWLERCQKGISLIEETTAGDDQRVMLGCLVRDISRASRVVAGSSPELVARYLAVRAAAAKWIKRLGRPIAPDEVEQAPSAQEDVRHVVNAPGRSRAPAFRAGRSVEGRGPGSRSTPPGPAVREVRSDGAARGLAVARLRRTRSLGPAGKAPGQARPPEGRRRLPAQVAKALAGAGVTVAAVERLTLEEVLELPGVGLLTVKRLERFLGRPFEAHAPYWIDRGLSARLAQKLAGAGIRSENQLRRLRSKDLQKIKGIGPRQVVLLMNLGKPAAARRRPLTFLEKVPQARIWVEAGILPGCARRLVAAGITSIAHLERLTRDDLLAIRGISEPTVAKCEKVLGRPLAESAAARWRARGLPVHLANALQGAGVSSVEQLASMSREDVLSLNGIGPKGLAACERLLGHPLQKDRGER